MHGRFVSKLCGKTFAGTVEAGPSGDCRTPEDNRSLRGTQTVPCDEYEEFLIVLFKSGKRFFISSFPPSTRLM